MVSVLQLPVCSRLSPSRGIVCVQWPVEREGGRSINAGSTTLPLQVPPSARPQPLPLPIWFLESDIHASVCTPAAGKQNYILPGAFLRRVRSMTPARCLHVYLIYCLLLMLLCLCEARIWFEITHYII